MVPQIVFNPNILGNYFPEPDFRQVPGGKMTSGITMPPLHAIASLRIYQHANDTRKAHDFLMEMFPKLIASHRYLYNTIVVHGIVELDVTSSVREVSNFFTHILYRIGDYTFEEVGLAGTLLKCPKYDLL